MKKKQIAASLLALTVACSMTACSGKPEEAADTTAAAAEQGEIAGDTNNDGQIDMGVDENVEVKQEERVESIWTSFEAFHIRKMGGHVHSCRYGRTRH